MKKINVVMLAAVFVLLNIFVVGCTYDKKRGFSFESPEDVVLKFLEHGSRLDFAEMRKITTKEALSKVGSIEMQIATLSGTDKSKKEVFLKNFFAEAKLVPYEKSYTLSDKNYVSDPSSFVLSFTASQNKAIAKAGSISFTLTRENKTSPWYISSFRDIALMYPIF